MFSAAAAREQMALSIEENLGSRNAAVTIDEFNQLAASVEHHLDKCELRAAKAVVDSLARLLPEGSRSSAALHAVLSARVYRSIDDESSARMYAQQALSHLPLNLPAARNLRAIALSLLHKYQEAFAEHRKAHREATPAALPALEMAQGKPVLVTLFKLEHDIDGRRRCSAGSRACTASTASREQEQLGIRPFGDLRSATSPTSTSVARFKFKPCMVLRDSGEAC